MKKAVFAGIFGAVLAGGLIFRAARLDLRPMHHDEANQAVKFGLLLEKGEYRYDREDHHGPSLYYLSLPFARLLSGRQFASLEETTLRLVTALFGTGIILLLLLAAKDMGPRALVFSGLCAALSPVMVFYSRFYIQETLLAFFLLGFLLAVWRYLRQPSAGWALAAGFFAGMMYATKETSVIAFGAVAAALVLTRLTWRTGSSVAAGASGARFIHGIIALASASLICLVLYSSFFQNSRGFIDSLLSFKNYLIRAEEPGWHAHPWYEYLKMLAFSKYGGGPAWSEGLILALACVGGLAAFKRRTAAAEPGSVFARFCVFYTAISTAVYSFIPYKTPWNALPFYIGFILLAGRGAVILLDVFLSRGARLAVMAALAAGFIHLGAQSFRANFIFYDDPGNPYVYAQTSRDFLNLIRRVEGLALSHPDRKNLLIKVIADPYETWPLPWYLRSYPRVGYWKRVEEAGDLRTVPAVITSLAEGEVLEERLKDEYVREFFSLRPGVFLLLHVRKDIWDTFIINR